MSLIGSDSTGKHAPTSANAERSNENQPGLSGIASPMSAVNRDLLAAAKRANRLLAVIARNIEPGTANNPIRDVVEQLEVAIQQAEKYERL